MSPIRTFLLTAACLAPLLASAQWQWIDKTGRKVFSDQPPPADVPDRNVLKAPAMRQPAFTVTPVDTAARPAPAASATAATPATPAAPASAASQSRAAAEAEASRRKAEEERIARLRAENCTRARSAKATLDTGVRLTRVNEKGEREILDDTARSAESRRLDEIIASDCKAP